MTTRSSTYRVTQGGLQARPYLPSSVRLFWPRFIARPAPADPWMVNVVEICNLSTAYRYDRAFPADVVAVEIDPLHNSPDVRRSNNVWPRH